MSEQHYPDILQTIQLRLEQEGFRKIVPRVEEGALTSNGDAFVFDVYNPRGEAITIQVEKRDPYHFAIFSYDGEDYNVFQGGFHL